MDCSLPGSSVHGIFQARALEWGAVAFSKKWTTDQCSPGVKGDGWVGRVGVRVEKVGVAVREHQA